MQGSGERLDDLERRKRAGEMGGGAERIAGQHKKGKMTARERIDQLLDEGSFQEIDALVEHLSRDIGPTLQLVRRGKTSFLPLFE